MERMVTQKQTNIDDLIPENIRKIIPYEPGKPIEEVEREVGIKSSIKLASNENPLGPSPVAIESVKKTLDKLNLYPESSGYYLRQKLAKIIGQDVTLDHIILGNGSSELIELTARMLISPGDEAIFAHPSFVMYNISVQYARGKAVKVPCKNHTHDLASMVEKVTPKTKLIYIANPNNPTGTIVEQDEFKTFMKEIPDHLVVVIDEAYKEYILDPNFPQSVPYVIQGKKLIILRTFSKIYGLAGFRIGYGIADPKIIKILNKVRQPFNTSSLGQIAGFAALDDR